MIKMETEYFANVTLIRHGEKHKGVNARKAFDGEGYLIQSLDGQASAFIQDRTYEVIKSGRELEIETE